MYVKKKFVNIYLATDKANDSNLARLQAKIAQSAKRGSTVIIYW